MTPILKTIDMTFTQTQPTVVGGEQTLKLKSVKDTNGLLFVLETKSWNFSDYNQVAELMKKLQETAKSLDVSI